MHRTEWIMCFQSDSNRLQSFVERICASIMQNSIT